MTEIERDRPTRELVSDSLLRLAKLGFVVFSPLVASAISDPDAVLINPSRIVTAAVGGIAGHTIAEVALGGQQKKGVQSVAVLLGAAAASSSPVLAVFEGIYTCFTLMNQALVNSRTVIDRIKSI